MLARRSRRPFWKYSFANSHRSGSVFRKPCALMWTVAASRGNQIHEQNGKCSGCAWGGGGGQGVQAAHVCIELPHETAEVVVLEALGQQVAREVRRFVDDEAASTLMQSAARMLQPRYLPG